MLRHGLNRILRRTEGATAPEYAFVLPILLFLIMGIVEYSLVMYGTAVLEGATIFAARAGKTGYDNTAGTGFCPSPTVNGAVVPQLQSDYIKCVVAARVSGLLDTTKLQIYSTSYTDYSGVGSPTVCTNTVITPTQNPPLCNVTPGSSGQVVLYTISYPWVFTTPFLNSVLGTNGVFTIAASALVKNEPYGSR